MPQIWLFTPRCTGFFSYFPATMAHSSVKNQNGFSCYFLITPLANAVRRLAAIELLSLIYAMWVFFTLKSAWLALAKYHGFAINLCLVLLIFPVLRNLKSIIVDCQSFPFPLMRKLSRRLSRLASCTRGKRHVRSPYCLPDHEFYSYRLLFSSLVHTLVHVLQTHPFNSADFSNFQRRYTGLFARLSATVSPPDLTQQAPINTSLLQPLNTTEMTKNASSFINVADFTETLLVYDRWTVSGYLLLLFFISELALGMRLMRFLVKHVYVLLVHRIINILITFVFLPAHHSNYFFILLPTLLFIVDYLIGAFVLTHSTKVRRVVIYQSFTSALPTTVTELSDEILEIDFDVISNRFAHSCQPGDYIAVKIPKISRWQWHHFTIMKHSGFSDSENSGTSQHNLRGVAVVRRKILIRCLGKWTHAILDHRDNNDLSMVIKGPYRSGQACSVKDLLARPFDRLVFMSPGTSITSHLSLLNGLIDEYWLRQTTTIATRHFYSSPARFNLPREIRLV